MKYIDDQFRYYGFYRAKVVDNVDPEKRGQVKVWIPDIMTKIPETEGIWALPANNPLGGRDPNNQTSWGYGTCYIPPKGSWVWVFFEAGDPSRPFYFGGLDLEQSYTVAENQVGSQYWNKWTIIRTKQGRVIIVSDDPDDERVEITSKKRQQTDQLDGDLSAIYTIDGNQSTILIDDRAGKEKILIKDYNGNTLMIRTHSNEIHMYCKGDFIVKAEGKIHLKGQGGVEIEGGGPVRVRSDSELHFKTPGTMNIDADHVHEQDGTSQDAQPKDPVTGRDD